MSISAINLRDYAVDQRGSVDDIPYGGGDSMVMRPEPLRDSLLGLPKNSVVILTSPGGRSWSHADCLRFADEDRPLVFVCGRFAGIDQRFIDRYVDYEFSMGDFVVSGGELPALMMADGVLRNCRGVLGNHVSAVQDSFGSGFSGMLEHPIYTRPRIFEDAEVPRELTSGNHSLVERWKREQSLKRTLDCRPDLLKTLNAEAKTERES